MKRLALFLLVFGFNQAHASGAKPEVLGPVGKWKDECSSCHVAYPPELLSAQNWQGLMGQLDRHFGVNATLNAQDNQAILNFLERYAGVGERYNASSLRISDTPWFRKEHRSVAAGEWSHPEVKSRSNCLACHGQAVLGN